MNQENYNSYSAVIDVDGNGWSSRLPVLLMSNTPILKQEYSSWMEYFAHLLNQSDIVTFFEEDLTDLIPIIKEQIESNENLEEVEDKVQKAFDFAVEHTSHHGVIRAMAYALSKHAEFLSWTVEMEEDYEYLPSSRCCIRNPTLPSALLSRMART